MPVSHSPTHNPVADGTLRIWRPNPDLSDPYSIPYVSATNPDQPQLLGAFRAITNLILIRRGPGFVMDWSQAAGTFTVGGDSREIAVWDVTTELKADVSTYYHPDISIADRIFT